MENQNQSRIRILYVAYPLLTVSEESAGGAEQVLWTLEREMWRRGVSTTVAASAGSCVAGELFSTGEPCRNLDDFERRNREHQEHTAQFILHHEHKGRPLDLVHDMSGGFWPRAGEFQVPLLATLHLPRHFYPTRLFENIPPNVKFNCVSQSQAASFAGLIALQSVVANGLALDFFEPGLNMNSASDRSRRSGLLWLGRVCEEKAPHLALEIGERAGMPVTIAGQIYPFSYHQQYFDREIAPRLQRMAKATFVQSPSAMNKRRLLREALAVVITSQVEETSSLVAMEAAASGTPVIAFARGALPEMVQDGLSGFLVDNVEDALRALQRISEISPKSCVRHARECFSSAKMADGYAKLYAQILGRPAPGVRDMEIRKRHPGVGRTGT
jgi:glycosyltransferase involved in cell wall biosynthesis